MADSSGVRLQMEQVEIKPASFRQTPRTSFGDQLKAGSVALANTARGVLGGAGYAIPGPAVLSAAVNGAGVPQDTSSALVGGGASAGGVVVPGANTAIGGMGGMGGIGGSSLDAVAGRAANGDSQAQLLTATQQMQEMNQVFNLQYLGIQQNMQAESRQFTAISNVMKAKYDTSKNTLSNLK